MPTIQEKIAQAKAAGYSDADIAQHLSSTPDYGDKIKTATAAGYKPEEIVAHLTGGSSTPSAKPNPQPEKDTSYLGQVKQNLIDEGAGLVRGAGSIGASLLYPIDKITDMVKGDRNPTLSDLVTGNKPISRNEERRQAIDNGLRELVGADPESGFYKTAKFTGELAGTAGAGGAVANGVRAVAPALGVAPGAVNALATATQSGGLNTGIKLAENAGAAAKAGNMLYRIAGGAVNGGATAGLINPEDAATGAVIGGALPPSLSALGKAGGYAGKTLQALVDPLTEKGQGRIANKIIDRFAESGPTSVNSKEIVKGSAPTLAEATGNPGIARLQSAVSDIAPNRFAERQAVNNDARVAALDVLTGDASKLDLARSTRSDLAGKLYGDAMKKGIDPANVTPEVQKQIGELMKRPSIQAAMKEAKSRALEDGLKIGDESSLQGLHYTKMGLDKQIAEAIRAGDGTLARSLSGTKELLGEAIEKLSPEYKQASQKFAELSKPVNQMEVLQSLNLMNAQGGVTLQKVQTAIDSLEKKVAAKGSNPAKSLTTDQLDTLTSIRDDLLRKSNLNAGKSAGSNTFQNIATDNILSSILPGKLGSVINGKIATPVGQLGKLVYSGANDKIKNKLADMMLDPSIREAAQYEQLQKLLKPSKVKSLADLAAQPVYRGAPLLSSSRE